MVGIFNSCINFFISSFPPIFFFSLLYWAYNFSTHFLLKNVWFLSISLC
jgi:hypothetical protein